MSFLAQNVWLIFEIAVFYDRMSLMDFLKFVFVNLNLIYSDSCPCSMTLQYTVPKIAHLQLFISNKIIHGIHWKKEKQKENDNAHDNKYSVASAKESYRKRKQFVNQCKSYAFHSTANKVEEIVTDFHRRNCNWFSIKFRIKS